MKTMMVVQPAPAAAWRLPGLALEAAAARAHAECNEANNEVGALQKLLQTLQVRASAPQPKVAHVGMQNRAFTQVQLFVLL
jgi:hypothetical protein